VTSRLVHGCASRKPGTGGTAAVLPVATTTAWFAVSVRVLPSGVVTSTVLGPASRPCPRTKSTPAFVSHSTWPVSSCPNGLPGSAPTNQSRRPNTAAASSRPVTASRTPGSARAWSYSSTGRSRALLGMQAQYEHSPPTSSCSTSTTDRPPLWARSATFSPGGPPPMTTTS
jgi:hypothetical protein